MAIGTATGGVSTAGQINFQGLGSGTDFSTLIAKLVAVEQTRVQTYVTWKESWLNKSTAVTNLNTQLLSLRTSLESIDTVDSFLQQSATSTNTDALTATAGGSAESGDYTFSIKQLAQNKVMVASHGYASLTQDINTLGSAATFTYTYHGVTVSNAIPASASLTDLVNIINTNGNNPGVRATTLYDGTNYFLEIRGLDMGASNSLFVSGSTLAGYGQANFQTTQNNQDALFKINGWPLSNAYMSRATNTVTDAIDGLSLKLLASGSGNIDVALNTSAVVANVQTFVSQVNSVITQINSLTAYNSTTQQASMMTGDYGLQLVSSIMNNLVANPGLGFDNTDVYSSLAPCGISVDADEGSTTFGELLLDQTTLTNVLASNSAAVGLIFAAQNVGGTDSSDITYSSSIDSVTQAGSYPVSYTVANGKITSATINGHPATFSSNSSLITGEAGYAEAGLVIQVDNLTNGTYNHNATLRLGKTGELVNELATLTDATNGPLVIEEQGCQSTADEISTMIDDENVRIQTMATNLKDQYSALDTLLGTYSNIQTELTSQIDSLSTSTSTS
jgi:flagellar hook-associated protein 2